MLGLGNVALSGVANIGLRPTFSGSRVLLEVFIFDFDEQIYGRNIEVAFLHKVRDEQRFDDFSLLIKQIHQDVIDAKQFFQCYDSRSIK